MLPVFLLLFLGSDLADLVDLGPFLEAFLMLIVIPLVLAWPTRPPPGRGGVLLKGDRGDGAADRGDPAGRFSQVPKLGDDTGTRLGVIPFYVAFLVVMAVLGLGTVRLFGLFTPDGRDRVHRSHSQLHGHAPAGARFLDT